MHRGRLNILVAIDIERQYVESMRVGSVLSPPSAAVRFVSKLTELEEYYQAQAAAKHRKISQLVIRIQPLIRSFIAKRRRIHRKTEKENCAAVRIQKQARVYLARQTREVMKIARDIRKIRTLAAAAVQGQYRVHRRKVCKLAGAIREIRTAAAIYIQKHARRFLCRLIFSFLFRSKPLPIKLKTTANSVYLCGNFTNPPWKLHIKMQFSSSFGWFYSDYLRENDVKPGWHLFRFVVNGLCICDESYEIEMSEDGNFYNKIEVLKRNSEVLQGKFRSNDELFRRKSKKAIKSSKSYPILATIKEFDQFSILLSGKTIQMTATSPKFDHFSINSNSQFCAIVDIGHCNANSINFAIGFLHNCENRLKSVTSDSQTFKNAIESAYFDTKIPGSAAILICKITQSRLFVANIGGSAVYLFRKQEKSDFSVSFKSFQQYFSLNQPYFLSRLGRNHRFECDFEEISFADVSIRSEDVLLLASDGLLNNLFESEILQILSSTHKATENPSNFLTKLASKLTVSAHVISTSSFASSPFSQKASMYGNRYSGGVSDDVTAIVAKITENLERK